MIATGTKNIGHGEFVGEFLYQLYREIACYGYDAYGEFSWDLMTEDQQTMHRAYNTVSITFDIAAHETFGRTNEFTWDEESDMNNTSDEESDMNNTSDFIYSVPAKLLQEGMHTHKTADSWFIPEGIVESCTHAYVGRSGTAYVYVTLQGDRSTYVSEADRYVSVIEPSS